MIRHASRSDLPAILALLASANDSPYDAAAVAEEKCFGRGFSGQPQTLLAIDRERVVGIAVGCGRYLRLMCVARDMRRRGVGSALLDELKPEVIAAEAGNYFTPGILEDDAAFFRRHGYVETAATWNLHVGLQPHASAFGSSDGMLEFIERNFGRIWRFEAERAAEAFFIRDTGFAVIEANNRGLGTFGPAGVAETMRGRGFGRQLLLAALGALHRRGFARAIIPWTDAIPFYRKSCGAEPAHRFVTYTSRP